MSTSSDSSFSFLEDADTQKEDTKTTTSTSSEDSFCILEDMNTQEENAGARPTKEKKMRKDEKNGLQSENKRRNGGGIIMASSSSTSSEDSFCSSEEENSDSSTSKIEKMRKDEKNGLQSENRRRNGDKIIMPSSTWSEDSFCSSEEENSDSSTSKIEKMQKDEKNGLRSENKRRNGDGIIMPSSSSTSSEDSFCSSEEENSDSSTSKIEDMCKDEQKSLESENEISKARIMGKLLDALTSSKLSRSTSSENSFRSSEEESSGSRTSKMEKMREDEKKSLQSESKRRNGDEIIMSSSSSTSSENSFWSSEEESSDSSTSKIQKMREDEKKSLQSENKRRNGDKIIMSSSSSTSSEDSFWSSEEESSDSSTSKIQEIPKDEKESEKISNAEGIIMSPSSEDTFCSSKNTDTQVENSDASTKTNKQEEVQKDEKENLQRNRKKKIMDLGSWPVFRQMPNFISEVAVIMAYCWNQRAIIVTEDKNVYSFGINDYTEVHYYFNMIEILCGKDIKTFVHNSYSVMALTEEGEVYIWNYTTHFKNKPVEVIFTLMGCLSEKRVVDIACGGFHSLGRTSDGKVYAWGEIDYYGVVCKRSDVNYLPVQVKFALEDKNVVQIACGYAFCIVLTDTRKLYGWGDGNQIPFHISLYEAFVEFLRDPLPNPEYYTHPADISISEQIVKVTCGDLHTLVLTDKGEVYAWGGNKFGQVGVDIQWKESHLIMVKMPELVVDIVAYQQSSVAIDKNGIIYVWGDFFGQRITTPFRTTFSKIHEAFMHTSTYNTMHKPVTISTDDYVAKESSMLDVIEAAFDDPSTSDFTVQVEGQLIYVHKSILQIGCQYFKNLFQRDSTENNQNTSSLTAYTVSDEYSYIVYRAFLKFIYTNTLDVSSEIAIELMKLADEYGEANLKKKCAQKIMYDVTTSNVIFFHNKAIDYHSNELEEFCFEFSLRHLKAVILSEDYSKLNMNAKDKLLWRAVKGNAFKT